MKYSYKEKKINFKDKIVFLLLLIILIWFSFDALRNSLNFAVIIILYLLWFMHSVIKDSSFFSKILSNMYPIIIWTILLCIRTVIGIGTLTHELNYAGAFIMIYIIFLYYKDKNVIYKKAIFYVVLICYTITGILTLYYLNLDTNLVRRSAAGLLNTSSYLNTYGPSVMMMGGWDYVYSIVGTNIVLINHFVKKKNKISKIPFILIVLLFSIIIIKASLSTAVVFLIALLLMNIAPKQKHLKILYYCIMIILGISILPLLEYILSFLSQNINNPNFIYKIEQSILMLRGDLSFSIFYSRFELMQYSLRTFFENPLVGVYGYFSYDYSVVSGHSQWIDDLARYGIISQSFFYLGLWRIRRNSLGYSHDKIDIRTHKIIYLYLFVLGFINPVMFIHIYLLVFIIIPFSMDLS